MTDEANDPSDSEIREAVRELVDRQHESLTLRCAACGALGKVERVTVAAPGFEPFVWLRMPDGWWALSSPELHVRCPECLTPG